MPEVGDAHYIIGLWFKIGLSDIGMNGAIPLSWQTIDAYCRLTKTRLDAFEVEAISDMSQAYCSWLNKGSKAECEAPYISETTRDRIERARLEKEALDRRLKKKPPK